MTDATTGPETGPTTGSTGSRTWFAPVALAGVAGAGLAALAGARAQMTAAPTSSSDHWVLAWSHGSATAPLVTALALVLLAVWGVLLVTRGRVRRWLAALGVVVALGLLAAVLWSARSVPAALREQWRELGVDDVAVHPTAWFWCALLAAVLCVVTTVAAARLVRRWPEMGRRYDGAARPPGGDGSNLDLWQALDEGRDPTNDQR